jgi:hypothetical protein
MGIFQSSDNELLVLANRIVENTRSSERVLNYMAAYGYDESMLEEGRALTEAFAETVRLRRDKHGLQLGATAALNDAWDAFHSRTMMPHLIIARLTFRDKATRTRLHINRPRRRRFAEYLKEARHFYTQLQRHPELGDAMAARGITPEKVQSALDDLEQLEKLNQAQEDIKGRRQQTTRRRNDERRSLAEWVSAFRGVARYALRDEPDLMEQFGMVAR